MTAYPTPADQQQALDDARFQQKQYIRKLADQQQTLDIALAALRAVARDKSAELSTDVWGMVLAAISALEAG